MLLSLSVASQLQLALVPRNDALGEEPTRALQQKPHHSMTSSAIASSVGGTLAERLRGPDIDLGDGLKRGRLGA